MTQEFYLKTKALHEEFQKRELHYLNTESKLRSSIMSKNEFNLPFQEYFQRINERERESEETYRNIMKQMEELDRHTDIMSQKLEKLGILRNSLASLPLPNWPSSTGSNLQIFSNAENFNSKSNYPRFESVEHNIKSTFQVNSESVSTQTENAIYCEKCHSLLYSKSRCIVESELPSFSNNQSGINIKPQTVYSESKENSGTLNETHANSQIIASIGNSELLTVPENVDTSIVENSKIEQQINEKPPKGNLTENHLESDKNVIDNIQNRNLRNEEKLTESQYSESEKCESKSPDAESNVDAVTKSDAESMNNEFDFLESDRRTASSKMKVRAISKNHKSPSRDAEVSIDNETSLMAKHVNQSPLKHTDKAIFHPDLKLELGDNKSETSGSVSASHSPIMSVASDSDSIYGKNSPVTASATYQAFLRNTKTEPNESDSESEDEVEHALANVIQRNHVKSKSPNSNQVAETKDKSSTPIVDPKPSKKGSKLLPTSNKPQYKLLKSTRKALGLETSSGSEVELGVKSAEKKIEEDSDEYDFYN